VEHAATAGYDLIEEVGVERIRENSLRQTELLIRLADKAGFEVPHRRRARVRRRADRRDPRERRLRAPPRRGRPLLAWESIQALCAFEQWVAEHSILIWSDYI
jgi:hypothetical protein